MIKWAVKNPVKGFLLAVFLGGFVIAGIKMLAAPAQMLNGAIDVAKKEFAPEVMLRKYEWFKDAAAGLEAMDANLAGMESKIRSMEDGYAGVSRKDWDRWDKQQYNIWQAELMGVKQVYNSIAADYNAQSNKFNWRMFDQTDGDPITKHFKER